MTRRYHTNQWPPEADEIVAKYWQEGRSAAEIALLLASEIGLVKTRCAIIGRVHRMDLPRDGRCPASAPHRPKVSAPVKIERVRVERPRPILVPPPSPPGPVMPRGKIWEVPPTAVPTLQLRACHCKFPVGPGEGMDQLHCGAPMAEGDASYCAAHRQVAGGKRTPGDVWKNKSLPRWAVA